MSHTLEMLSSSSVTRLNVSGNMVDWWDNEIGQRRMASSSSSTTDTHSLPEAGKTPEPPKKPEGSESEKGGQGDKAGPGEKSGGDGEQALGDGKMPGPGGT